jgi:exodeoxyribonuclease VII small subunit
MNKKKETYKEAISEIEEILAQIENNELDVDELSEKVKRVSLLINFCKSKLKNTEEEIEKILREMDHN